MKIWLGMVLLGVVGGGGGRAMAEPSSDLGLLTFLTCYQSLDPDLFSNGVRWPSIKVWEDADNIEIIRKPQRSGEVQFLVINNFGALVVEPTRFTKKIDPTLSIPIHPKSGKREVDYYLISVVPPGRGIDQTIVFDYAVAPVGASYDQPGFFNWAESNRFDAKRAEAAKSHPISVEVLREILFQRLSSVVARLETDFKNGKTEAVIVSQLKKIPAGNQGAADLANFVNLSILERLNFMNASPTCKVNQGTAIEGFYRRVLKTRNQINALFDRLVAKKRVEVATSEI